LFGGKTELEVNNINILKESAEILARTIESFPTHKTAIAIIGFITSTLGLYFFAKGFVMFICGHGHRTTESIQTGRFYGFVQCIVGLGFLALGTAASLYSGYLTHHFF